MPNNQSLQVGNDVLDDPRFDTANDLIATGRLQEAIDLYDRLLEEYPDNPRALYASGFLLHRTYRTAEAIVRINKALLLQPDFPKAYNALGTVLMMTGQVTEALNCYAKAVQMVPNCLEFQSNFLFCLECHGAFSAEERFNKALAFSRDCLGVLSPRTKFPNLIDPEKPIRTAFISPDLGVHPVGMFLIQLFQCYDRRRFHFVCYSTNERQDDVATILKNNSFLWRDVKGFSDDKIAQCIEHDRIDVLIDLSGHTGFNRLPLFAKRAAPVQISWLGYSATTAVPAMDYIFTDATAVSPAEEQYYTESVYRFSSSRFCYLPVGEVPEVAVSPCLHRGYCTFGSFNNLAKLTPEVVALWSEILKSVNGSRLVLKTHYFADEYAKKRYLDLFAANNIAPDRVELRQFSTHSEMLAEYADIDIALDPFPYCGGMTSCNALWMGVPVITLITDRAIGRQTQSFLELIGQEELIATKPDEYITIAVQLASNHTALAALRASLRNKIASSALCDPYRFTSNFETALRDVWTKWCSAQDQKYSQYPWDDPRFEQAYCSFQGDLADGKSPRDAFELYTKLLTEYPDHPRALHALGVVLHNLGESEEGVAYIRRALVVKPGYGDALNNLGSLYLDIHRHSEAEDCFKKYVALHPENPLAHKNLARAQLLCGKRTEAFSTCNTALRLAPDNPEILLTMGNILMDAGDALKTYEFLRRARLLAPEDADIHTNYIYTMNFLAEIRQEDIYRESLRWGRLHTCKSSVHRPHLNSPLPHRKLRIGYVSGDLKFHPVSYHLKPVIEFHDRDRFEVFLYSVSNESDEMTDMLRHYADQWRYAAKLSHSALEEMIRVDGIDILVDLSGYTAYGKLELFSRKPAPVQVSWFGYFNTTGIKTVDYLISDQITVPFDEERWFSEKVIRLPEGRFCYEPPIYSPEVSNLPAITNKFITFGSFNKLSKITEQTVAIWSDVLRATTGARMVLKTAALQEPTIANRVINMFEQHGISPDRIELRGKSFHQQMLSEYGDIDICLDTFPFNGGATTCESLWMGVPVITLSGHTPISRQSSSLLAACGLSKFVAYTKDQFISCAVALASDIPSLAKLRMTMRKKLIESPLCNGKFFTANLENAYHDMWNNWCNKHINARHIKFNKNTSYEEYYNAAIDRMDQEDDQTAIRLLRFALRKRPDSAKAYNNLGISLFNNGLGHYRQAASCFRKAISIDPQFGAAYKHLGRTLVDLKKPKYFQEAEEALNQAVTLLSDDAIPLLIYANFKLSQGHAAEAVKLYRKALSLAPDDALVRANLIFAMNYLPECSQETILEASREWDIRHGWQGASGADFNSLKNDNKKLKIGFISADFHRHPVGIFFQAYAVNYNRNCYEVICYNNKLGQKIDEISAVIRNNITCWKDVKALSDDELWRLIVEDRIQVLVDLSGYTADHRLQVFSRRAAPVQVSWLGYYNTTGISAIDYVITDEETVPTGMEQWYSEKIIKMPYSRFCYTPPYVSPDVEELPTLSRGYITFGSFNNFSKITEEVIAIWSKILMMVPKSRLILKWNNFAEKTIKSHYQSLFEQNGISSRRITFRNASPPFAMQDEYNEIDIALDPFPFSGGLTSCEALWMGVPVITFAGDRPVSRQTAGFLRAIGLDELIANDLTSYAEKAVQLAKNQEHLVRLRSGLRQQLLNSPLCDGKKFTHDIENIFNDIFSAWVNNKKQYIIKPT